MGVVYQKPEQDKYSFEGGAGIDCENRLHLCQAACCKLPFALSKQDVEEGVVRWDFSAPYLIAHGPDGYCQHLDQEKNAAPFMPSDRFRAAAMTAAKINVSGWISRMA